MNEDRPIPHDARRDKKPPATCRGCRRPIIWARTVNGKLQPLDRDPNSDGNVVATGKKHEDGRMIVETLGPLELAADDGRTRYMPHHATCPKADRYKKS